MRVRRDLAALITSASTGAVRNVEQVERVQ
jgi:hypothetical protein